MEFLETAMPNLSILMVPRTAVVVNAVSYTVSGIEPDGTGMTKLKLEKA